MSSVMWQNLMEEHTVRDVMHIFVKMQQSQTIVQKGDQIWLLARSGPCLQLHISQGRGEKKSRGGQLLNK